MIIMHKQVTSAFPLTVFLFACFFLISCAPEMDRQDWPTGNLADQIEALADHHQGFSRTMIEVSYRYNELIWAGRDHNWDYADYQLEHMEEALEHGFERRPARKASAEGFLTDAIPAVKEAISNLDSVQFEQAISLMTLKCNTCHTKEDVPFFYVVQPTVRNSIIRIN